MKELEEEVEELRAQVIELRETLEKETLSKVDLQNQIQSIKEELSFRKKVYEEVCEHSLRLVCVCCYTQYIGLCWE